MKRLNWDSGNELLTFKASNKFLLPNLIKIVISS